MEGADRARMSVRLIRFRGFEIGDKVSWKEGTNTFSGTILLLQSTESCLIKTEDDATVELKYDEITKTSASPI